MKWSLANRTLTIVFIFVSQFSLAQKHTGKEFHFPPVENLSDSNPLEYHARDHIKMGVGTHITPSAKQEFHAVINEFIVLDSVSFEQVPSNYEYAHKEVDINLPVGKINGSAYVDPSGSANYSIPIFIPQGTNGMNPNLNLIYNSNGGNGTLGRGWNVQGLSSITRTGKRWDYDFEKTPITLTNEDYFVLNGSRLIGTYGSYGGHASTYATEVESYSRVTSFGTSGNGPSWFKVEAKNGQTFYYGDANNSRVNGDDTGTGALWMLNKVIDKHGNYILYHYTQTNGEPRIQEITWTHNDSENLAGYNSIKFFYETKDASDAKYPYSDKAFYQTHLLKEIQIQTNGIIFKRYEFKYYRQIHDFLYEVIESDGEGNSLNSTLFKYSHQTSNVTTNITPTINAGSGGMDLSDKKLLWTDFNGDGWSDALMIRMENNLYKEANVLLNNKGKLEMAGTASNLPGIENEPEYGFFGVKSPVGGQGNLIHIDSDGDGSGEFVFPKMKELSGGRLELESLHVYDYDPNSVSKLKHRKINIHPDFNTLLKGVKLISTIGDFDGDGKSELVLLLSDKSNETAEFVVYSLESNRYIEISGLFKNEVKGRLGYYDKDHDQDELLSYAISSDFKGAGKSYLMIVGPKGCAQYDLDFHGTNGPITYSEHYLGNSFKPAGERHIYPVDFNNDGKEDFIDVMNEGSSTWNIKYSIGNSYLNSPIPAISNNSKRDYFRTGDVNGDGFIDFICPRKSGFPSEYFTNQILINNGKGEFTAGWSFRFAVGSDPLKNDDVLDVYSADVNGDGKADLIVKTENYLYASCYQDLTEKKYMALEEVIDGYGSRQRFSYLPLTNESIYSKERIVEYPISNNRIPYYVVSSLTQISSDNISLKTDYEYKDLLIHKRGLGVLGFGKVESTAPTGIRSVQSQTFDSFFFVSDTVVSEVWNGGYLVTEQKQINDVAYGSSGQIVIQPNTIRVDNYLEGTYSVAQYQYDDYGNLIDLIEDKNGTLNIHTSNAAFLQKGTWIPSSPSLTTITKTRKGHEPHTKQVKYGYYLDGTLRWIADYFGTDGQLVSNFKYDGFGNVVEKGISDKIVINTRGVTKYTYDVKGRFVIESENPLGYKSSFEYHAFWGKETKNTNVIGKTSSYVYDSFGRLTNTNTILGHKLEHHLEFFEDEYTGKVLIRSYTVGDQMPTTFKRIDLDGKLIQTVSNEYSGNVYVQYKYDQYGRDTAVSNPYFLGDNITWNIKSYDIYGRIEETKSFVGEGITPLITSFDYQGLSTTTVTPDGLQQTLTQDGIDNIISSKDKLGNIVQIEYNSQNLPINTRVIENGNEGAFTGTMDNTSGNHMRYDLSGNQKVLFDPNSDSNYYHYNAFQELIWQVNPQGDTTKLTYDDLGRVLEEKSTEGTTVYTYNNEGNGIGQLQKIVAPNGYSKVFEYDEYGKVTKITETIDDVDYSYIYDYDYNSGHYGRLRTMTYPSGYLLRYYYSPGRGYLTTIKGPNLEILWERELENALGQITNYQIQGTKIRKRYNEYGLLTEHRDIGSNKFNYQYQFNPETGSLEHRKDLGGGRKLTENFYYDGDRLSSGEVFNEKTGESFTSFDVSYSANGNIQTNSSVGIYSYDETRKHALKEITPFSEDVLGLLPDQNISYTSFHSIKQIDEGEYSQTFEYGYDKERRKSTLFKKDENNWNIEKIRYYLGSHEREVDAKGDTTKFDYISAPGVGLIGVHVETPTTNKTYTIIADYLGNITAVFDANNYLLEDYSIDAWGHYRNPNDWTNTNVSAPSFLFRGYTGHEHMPEFGLINMNGRLYDPSLGRMLSPDNFVQSPYNSQNYNRYSYVLNNPLKYTDPSGEFIFTALALIIPGAQVLLPIAIGADIGAITGGIRGANNPDVGFWGGAARGTAVGAVGGALSMVGGGTFVANVAWGAGQGAITGGLDATLWGNDIGKGMLYGAAAGATFASVTSGIEAYGNYKNGHGFRTDVGVIKNYTKLESYDQAIDFVQAKHGLTGVNMTYDASLGDYGVTDPTTGNVRIGKDAFDSPSLLKATVAHEYGHSTLDRVLDANGNFTSWKYPVGSYNSNNATLATDGPLGYAQEIYNAGRMKIGRSVLSDSKLNPLWSEWNRSIGGSRFFHTLPRRFNNSYLPLIY